MRSGAASGSVEAPVGSSLGPDPAGLHVKLTFADFSCEMDDFNDPLVPLLSETN